MISTRREFLIFSISLVAGAGCGRNLQTVKSISTGPDDEIVDAGPVSDYAKDGVYDAFRQRGFFVIRRDTKLIAQSAICTHRGCKVRADDDESFYCKCHGSKFDRFGNVTHGPAARGLPGLAVSTDDRGNLMVDVSRRLS